MLLDPGTATVDQFRDAFKTLCTKASTVTTPDAEKKNLWPRALEAHRALPPVEKKNLITLWGKGPLKAFEGFAGNAALAFKWPHFTRLKEGCVSTETRALHNKLLTHLPPPHPHSNTASAIAFMHEEEEEEEEGGGGGGGGGGAASVHKTVVVCKGCLKPMFEYTGVASQKRNFYCSTREEKDYPAGHLHRDAERRPPQLSHCACSRGDFGVREEGLCVRDHPALKGASAVKMALLDGGDY